MKSTRLFAASLFVIVETCDGYRPAPSRDQHRIQSRPARGRKARHAAPPQPTLELEFDDGRVDGRGRRGKKVRARVEGSVALMPGKFGKAFLSGPGAGYLHYPTSGIVLARQGTVEMWVSPVDWSGRERAFHSFFHAQGKGALYLYKYFSNANLLMLTAADVSGRYHSAAANIESWRPGEWHHIAGTWSIREQAVYIDGKRIAVEVPNLPSVLGTEVRIGDHPWRVPGLSRTSKSLVDRVRIYDRALSPEHIAAHFRGVYHGLIPPSLTSAKLDWSVDTRSCLVTVSLAVNESDEDPERLRADIEVGRAGRLVEQHRGVRLGTDWLAAAVFRKVAQPGDYDLRVVLKDVDGQRYDRIGKVLTVPDSAQWLHNTLGKEKRVLEPWTPLQVKRRGRGLSVSCWKREYVFDSGGGAWPSQMVSQGKPLLSSPIGLQVTVGSETLSWRNGDAVLLSANGHTVEIEGRAEADTAKGRVYLTVHYQIEYDGLVLVTMKLAAPLRWRPDTVVLKVPLHEERTLYRHRWSSGSQPLEKVFSGTLGTGQGRVDSSPFLPASWLGDDERGLFWFCESAQHWPNWRHDRAYQTVREGRVVSQLFGLIDGQPLPESWSFQFGWQATPVKPIPRDWRKWRLAPSERANIEVLWPDGTRHSTKHFGYAEAADPKLFQARVDASRAKGRRVLPYSLLTGMDPAAPEWKWFHEKWDVRYRAPPAINASPTRESWQDFVVWKNKVFLERHKLDGFYHDLTYPYGWSVPSAGTGWFDGKQWHRTYPMMAYRELYRRNRAALAAVHPKVFLIGHISARMAIPVVGYEDAYLDGEQFRDLVKDSYMDVLSLDQWRAGFLGRQWGVIPIFLPEFDAAHRKVIEPTRGLAALVMLHDVSVWPIWSHWKAWKEMYDALDAFGHVDSVFIPYFDPAPPARTEIKDVYISVYKRSDGRALAVVANTSRYDRSGFLTLNGKRIGLSTTHVMSWPDRTPIPARNGRLFLEVPRLGYRLLLMGRAP